MCLGAGTLGLALVRSAEKKDMLVGKEISATVVFDNNPHAEGLQTSWGFACVVRGAEKTILFDTGGDGAILLANMKKLAIDPRDIDAVVLSQPMGITPGAWPPSLPPPGPGSKSTCPDRFRRRSRERQAGRGPG